MLTLTDHNKIVPDGVASRKQRSAAGPPRGGFYRVAGKHSTTNVPIGLHTFRVC